MAWTADCTQKDVDVLQADSKPSSLYAYLHIVCTSEQQARGMPCVEHQATQKEPGESSRTPAVMEAYKLLLVWTLPSLVFQSRLRELCRFGV